jgi:hypothetical protein
MVCRLASCPANLFAAHKSRKSYRRLRPELFKKLEIKMAIYELRTYTITVGKMSDVVALYKAEGWPALSKHPAKLCGYFTGDIGALNQLVHLWKFDDEADRRKFWDGVYGDQAFMNFAKQLRPLLQSQENKLLLAAPWGPQV